MLQEEWKAFLKRIDRNETTLAKELNMNQSNLNRKIRTETIKYTELEEIIEKYGYTLKITPIKHEDVLKDKDNIKDMVRSSLEEILEDVIFKRRIEELKIKEIQRNEEE